MFRSARSSRAHPHLATVFFGKHKGPDLDQQRLCKRTSGQPAAADCSACSTRLLPLTPCGILKAMSKKSPTRTTAATGAARKTGPATRSAVPEAFAAGHDSPSKAPGGARQPSKAAAGGAATSATLSPALRSTLEHLAATAFARIGFAPDEAPRLRSEVRQLRRQVAVQARQIQQLRANQAAPASKPTKAPAAGAGRAARAVQEWQARLADEHGALTDDSEVVRRRWVDDGLLVPTSELVHAWGLTRQALDQARERGDLVGLKVANRQYYPAAFLELKAEDVASICRALVDVDPVSRIIFWQRPHANLDDQTLAQAIQAEGLATALHAAEAFADEQAGVTHAPAEPAARTHAA